MLISSCLDISWPACGSKRSGRGKKRFDLALRQSVSQRACLAARQSQRAPRTVTENYDAAKAIRPDFLGDLHQGANLAQRRKSEYQRVTARHRSIGGRRAVKEALSEAGRRDRSQLFARSHRSVKRR